jgi:hypothetical protein
MFQLRGIMPLRWQAYINEKVARPGSSSVVRPRALEDQGKYIWRDNPADKYRVCQTYKDVPLDLTHFLIVKTRENMLLRT